jgi:hypothetical protein
LIGCPHYCTTAAILVPDKFVTNQLAKLIPATARSMSWVCGSLLAVTAGSNPAGGMDTYFEIVVCCQAEVSATGRLFVQDSSTKCDVSEYDLGTSRLKRPWPARLVEL